MKVEASNNFVAVLEPSKVEGKLPEAALQHEASLQPEGTSQHKASSQHEPVLHANVL